MPNVSRTARTLRTFRTEYPDEDAFKSLDALHSTHKTSHLVVLQMASFLICTLLTLSVYNSFFTTSGSFSTIDFF